MANWTANVPFIYDKILTGRYTMPEGKTYLLKCIECGADFLTEGEKGYYKSKWLSMPKRCKPCRDKRKFRLEQEREEKELKGFLLTLPKDGSFLLFFYYLRDRIKCQVLTYTLVKYDGFILESCIK